MLGNLKCVWSYFSKACLNLQKQLVVLCLKQLLEILLLFNPELLVGGAYLTRWDASLYRIHMYMCLHFS